MLGKRLKELRKARGMSQAELAARLNVVRQTVSKWERGISLPDAAALLDIAKLFDVSVSLLLGLEADGDTPASEADRLREALAQREKEEALRKKAEEKRGFILFLSFAAMLAALVIGDPLFSLILSAVCLLLAVAVLYKNLGLLSGLSTGSSLTVLRVTTLFNIGALVLVVLFALLTSTGVVVLPAYGEKLFAMFLTASIMIFGGIVSPKLPFTRHTGLRLPWTVRDQETWELAHRVLGFISLPIALLYIACALTVDSFESVSITAVLLWVGIPGCISFVYYQLKLRGKL